MSDQPSAALLAALDESPAREPSDKLDALRQECERLRDDDLEVADLEARLEAVKARRQKRLTETVPDLMDQVGVPEIVIAAAGNKPAARVSIEPYYKANIAADWEEDKRRAAFDWLDADGSGDLIKTVVTVGFPREDRSRALEVVAAIRKLGVDSIEVGEAVAWGTLTAWLKERHKANGKLPPLDVLGATIGRVAKIKPVKEKK
jgi:hypothetical protein